jgi:hypothetical protein
VDEFSDLVFPSGLKEIEGSSSVALKERFGLGYASINVSLSSEIDYKVRIPQDLPYEGMVCKVSLNEPVSDVSFELPDVCRVAPHQITVDIRNFEILTYLYYVMDEVAPDEAETACND